MTVQMDKKKTYSIVGVIAAIFIIGAAAIFYTLNFDNQSPAQPYSSDEREFIETEIPSSFNTSEDLIKFSSNEEVVQFLKDVTQFNSEFPTHGGLVRFDRTASGVFNSREGLVVSEPIPSPEPGPTPPGQFQSIDEDLAVGSEDPYQDYSSTNV